MKKILVVFFCMNVFWIFSQKCTYNIQGTIVDFHDGSIIDDATILIKNTNKFAVSDSEGNFTISNVCNGKITLVISHIGCKTSEKTIKIDGNYTGKFLLEHHSEELEEVTLKGKIVVKKVASLSETVLSKKMLENYSAASLGDALKEIAGVSSINTGNAIVKPMINGMHSSRIIVMNNGVRLQDQEWGIEHAPNIDLNSSESVSVIKGAGALAFGSDAIGGVVLLNPKNPIRKDSLFGSTIAGFQTNGKAYNIASSLHKTYKNGYFLDANATHKRFGDFRAPDYFLTNTGSKSTAFSLNVGYKTFETGWNLFVSSIANEIGILGASHIGGIQDLVNALNSQQPLIQNDFSYRIDNPKQDVTHFIAKASYFKRFQNVGKLTLQYDFQENQRFEYDRRIGDNRFIPAVDLNLQTHTATADFLFDAKNSWTFQSGTLFRFQENVANPATGVRRLIPDYQKTDAGIYTTIKHEFSENWLFDTGFRYDFNFYGVKKFYQTSRWSVLGYDVLFPELVIQDLGTQLLTNPELSFHNFAMSLGAKRTLSEENSLLLNYTMATRPPNIAELFSDGLHHSAARIELGSLTLNSEKSNRFSLSFLKENSSSKWQIDTYINTIQDYIFIAPNGTEQTIRGAFPKWEYRQTDALLVGFDINIQKEFSENWGYSLNTSYIYAQDTENKMPIIDMPPFQMKNSISYNNNDWHGFSSTLISEFIGRQNRFPDFNFNQFIAETNTTVLVDISTPPNAYHLFHINNTMNFDLGKHSKIQVSLNINNLLNTSYRNYLNRLRFFADDLGRNFQLQIKINY
jgi:iron complex outermembrane receptor protein